MRENLRTLFFAAALATVCSLALLAANSFTKPYREANEKAERVRNFLGVLDVPVPEGSNAEALNEIFSRDVREVTRGTVTLFEYVPASGDGSPVAVAVPFTGPGLWGQIHGILALEPDLRTIRGVRFYRHEETPGLGGEISAAWFLEQFPGRSLIGEDGTAGFRIPKPGGATGLPNAVDGISGATMTCDRVQAMLDGLAKQLAEDTVGHDG